MGNLYTQLQRKSDNRITLLTKLKYEYRNNPRDEAEIKKLKLELNRMDRNRKKNNI